MVMMWNPRRRLKQKEDRGISISISTRRKLLRLLLISLAFFAVVPPLLFHFKLKSFRQMQIKKCSWLSNPPLVCAHGGDSFNAFPNTSRLVVCERQMAAYRIALSSHADCIEIDVSRSSDGVLFALHDRDLQRLTGNNTSRVGYLSMKEINELETVHQSELKFHNSSIPTIEDALKLTSTSVRRIILDAKIGPPAHEKGLAKDILSIVEKTKCNNCLVWAKSDNIARDVMKLSSDVTSCLETGCWYILQARLSLTPEHFLPLPGSVALAGPKPILLNVGYIVMIDHSTGVRTNLLRMRGAGLVGVYHPLVDKKLVKILHRQNKKVYAWTVDDEAAMQKMLHENVDAIVTSNPTLLQRLMQEIRTQCLEEGFSFSAS